MTILTPSACRECVFQHETFLQLGDGLCAFLGGPEYPENLIEDENKIPDWCPLPVTISKETP